MSSLIVAAIPLTGHTGPMLAIARQLTAEGHAVTFLGGRRFADAARRAGTEFVPLPADADFDDRELPRLHPRLPSLPAGPPQFDYLHRWFADMAAGQYATVQRIARSSTYDAVLYDMAFLGTWPTLLGGPGIRVKSIGVGMLPFILPGAEVTLMGPPPAMPGLDRRGAAAVINAETEEALASSYEYVDAALKTLGATRTVGSFLKAVYTVPDAFIQLTVPGFEYPRTDLPATVRFGGLAAPEPTPSWKPPMWWPDLNGRRVVAVTQGTMANHDLSQLIQPTFDALSDTDFLIVAALGREPRIGELEVPANARVEAFIPFSQLFRHTDVFVTNGGYGGTQLALAHALPVVVAGGSEDKPMTAARAAAFGVGVDLGTPRPDPSAISRAITATLDDPSYRRRARTLADEYNNTDLFGIISELIDSRPSG